MIGETVVALGFLAGGFLAFEGLKAMAYRYQIRHLKNKIRSTEESVERIRSEIKTLQERLSDLIAS